MITSSVNADDRISQLPDHILHHILSFLSTPEVVRLSVLSKAWHHVFTSFPLSEFSSSPLEENPDRLLQFATCVYTSLIRQCRHYRNIPNFQLSVSTALLWHYSLPAHRLLLRQIHELINRCIRLGTQKGIRKLSIDFRFHKYYRLSKAILSVKELVVCRLYGCVLDSTINWPSIRELSLNQVIISGQRIIDNLSFTCPFLEKFAVIRCDGLKYLHLSGFRELKKVKVNTRYSGPMKKIEIDVVTLHTFSYNSHDKMTPIDLSSCKNLKVLKYKGGVITENLIQYIRCNFPELKVLELQGFHSHPQRIEISLPVLEKLKLFIFDSSTKDTIINTPKLQSFSCYLNRISSLFSLNQTSLQKVSIECYSSSKIREIVSKVSNPVLLRIGNLKLETYTRERDGQALVDGLFCIFRPESLTLVSGRARNNEFMEILCKKLVRRGTLEHYCAAIHEKCWQHDLKDVKIKHCGRMVACDAFLDSVQTLESKKKILFVFEWRSKLLQ